MGRKVQCRDDWEDVKQDVMYGLLLQKFEPGRVFGVWLAKTGSLELVETNDWDDQIWGDCYCSKHKDTPGQNILGIMLMAIRMDLPQ